MTPITTNILRSSYERGDFSFGNPHASRTVVLIGSCRILPFLNTLRVFNDKNGGPFEMLCFDPVEMWGGVGCEVADGVNQTLKDYCFGHVDYLICEHVQYCGMLNTVRTSEQNIFNSLGCAPDVEIRVPNWNEMHIFDVETAGYDKGYAALPHDDRVRFLRSRTADCKDKFMSHCRASSFPTLEDWVGSEWLTTRMGWTSNHPSIALSWQMFEGIAGIMGIKITDDLRSHPLCSTDWNKSTGMVLNAVDYEANNWKF